MASPPPAPGILPPAAKAQPTPAKAKGSGAVPFAASPKAAAAAAAQAPSTADQAATLTAQADALLAGTPDLKATSAADQAASLAAQAPSAADQAAALAAQADALIAGTPKSKAAAPPPPSASAKALAKKAVKTMEAKGIKNAQLKTGVYNIEGVAFGSLVSKCLGKHYAFMITNIDSSSEDAHGSVGVWAADLVPAPKAPPDHEHAGKDIWLLTDCPEREGSLFVRHSVDAEGDNPQEYLIECNANFDEQWRWKLCGDEKGKMFAEPVTAPVKIFPSPNFTEAVLEKDPSENEPFSPSTDTIIAACCNEINLPTDPKERQGKMIRLYTAETPLYHEMNAALRQDDLFKMKYFGAYIKELRDCFKTDHVDEIIEPFEGKVWRGISFPDPKKALEDFAEGHVFVWPAFTSMTTNRSVALGFGNLVFEISCEPPAGTFEDDNPEYAPASVQKWSVYKNEAEILFPPNIKFQVLRIDQPSEDNDLQSPLVVCATVAFDTDAGLAEFSLADKDTARTTDLWKTVVKHRKQLEAQSQIIDGLQTALDTEVRAREALGETVKVLAARLGLKLDGSGAMVKGDAFSGALEDELYASIAGNMPAFSSGLQGLGSSSSSPGSPQKSGMGGTLLPASMAGGNSQSIIAKCGLSARDLAKQMADEMDREMSRTLDAEMGREMAREMARNMARMMAKGVSRDMARKVVQSKMQGGDETYGVDDIIFG